MNFTFKMLLIFCLAGVLFSANAYAGNGPKKIKVETETQIIKENQPFKITFSISFDRQSSSSVSWSNNGADPKISELKMEDFDLVDGPNKSSTTSFSNGLISHTDEYNYIVIAKSSGKFFIAPVKYVVENQDFISDTFWITIIPGRISSEDSLEKLSVLKGKTKLVASGSDNIFSDFFGRNTKTVSGNHTFSMDTVYYVKKGETFVVTYLAPFITRSDVQIKDQPCPTGIVKLEELPKSSSTNMSWEKGGGATASTSTIYPVKFLAKKKGKYILQPRTFAYDGHEYASPRVTVNVTR